MTHRVLRRPRPRPPAGLPPGEGAAGAPPGLAGRRDRHEHRVRRRRPGPRGHRAGRARGASSRCSAGEIRDRERGFMEIPFAVALTSVADRVEDGRGARGRPPAAARSRRSEARRRVIEALAAALRRLEAFQAAYDAKTPLPEARSVGPRPPADRSGATRAASVRPAAAPVPDRRARPRGPAARRPAPRWATTTAPWHVTPPDADQPADAGAGVRPRAIGRRHRPRWTAPRASWRSGTRSTCEASAPGRRASAPAGSSCASATPTGSSLETTVGRRRGPEARLTPEAEQAVRVAHRGTARPRTAPACRPSASSPCTACCRCWTGRCGSSWGRDCSPRAVRMGALELPREKTRKAARAARAPRRSRAASSRAWPRHGSAACPPTSARAAGARRVWTRWTPRCCWRRFGRDVARGAGTSRAGDRARPLTDADVTALVQSLVGRGDRAARPRGRARGHAGRAHPAGVRRDRRPGHAWAASRSTSGC